MRNLRSKGSVEVKCKDDICAELCLKLCFESDWYFCNITKSRWFWKRLSRNKVQNNHFPKLVQKQPYADFFKIGALKNFATAEHLCWSLFLIQLKKRPQHIAKFLRTPFLTEHLWLMFLSFCQFDKVTVKYWTSVTLLLLFKNAMWDSFYQKGLKTLAKDALYIFLVETIPTRF